MAGSKYTLSMSSSHQLSYFKGDYMESLIRNLLLIFGVLYIMDFVTEYPKTVENIDTTFDTVKARIGSK